MKNVRSFVLALAVAAGATAQAWAAPGPEMPQRNAASAAAQTDSAPPSASRLAAAHELLDAMNAVQLVEGITNSMLGEALARLRASNPQVSDRALATISKAFREEFAAHTDELMELLATIYATNFNEDELHQLAGFYRSDLGRKTLELTPKMMQQIMPDAERIGQEVAARVRVRVRDALQPHGEAP